MYTEIYVNVDLDQETPEEVIEVLEAMCDQRMFKLEKLGIPGKWAYLFCNGSYYTPGTCVSKLTYDKISERYSLIGKGDLKNYDREVEEFFAYIKPWVEPGFIGYHRYEEDIEPTLVYKKG